MDANGRYVSATVKRRELNLPDFHALRHRAAMDCDDAEEARDLLIVGRAGALPVRPEPFPARALPEGVRQRFADRTRERRRSIVVDADAGLVAVGDELRLRQALSNLVDNALRHGAGEIVMRGRCANGGVALEVQDAGPGFGDAIARHAFERLARSDSARGHDGTGLGLPIVRTIAEAHSGRAELIPAAGANVRIWLPQGDLSQPT